MFCDFHGHSRKHMVFMYGCNNPELPVAREQVMDPLFACNDYVISGVPPSFIQRQSFVLLPKLQLFCDQGILGMIY